MIQEETLTKKFIQKGFWIYLFAFIIAPLGYITRMAISRDLSVEEVGMLYGVFSFITLLAAFNDFGCTESLNYFLPKYIIKNEYHKAKYLLKITLFIQLGTSAIIGAMIFFLAPWLAEHYFKEARILDILQVATIYFIGSNLTHLSTILLSISQNMKILKGIDFLRAFFMVLGVCLLYFTDSGNLLHYAWIWISSIFVTLLFSGAYTYIYYYRPNFIQIEASITKEEKHTFYKYALATLFTANVGTLLSQVDMQMIIYLLGSKETGYYSNYLSIISLPFMVLTPIIGFLFPVISELHGRGNYEKIRLLQGQISLYVSIFIIWMSVFLVQFGETLSVFFFGENFAKSGTLLQFSAGFLIFNLLSQINFQVLGGTGNVRERGKILLIILPINIILNALCIYQFQIFGSALAVGISWIPLWYLSHAAIREYRGKFDISIIFLNILFAMFCALGIHFLFKNLNIVHPGLIIGIAVCINLIIFCLGNFKILMQSIGIIREHRNNNT